MATTHSLHPAAAGATSSSAPATQSHVLHAVHTWLRYLFTAVPIIAGADKFTHFLVQWDVYLNPLALRIVPVSASTFMHLVGVIEIVAGILVFVKPKIGGYVVMGWLLAIALQLLVSGQYLDIAVRDMVIALSGAWVLARLSPLASSASARHARQENA